MSAIALQPARGHKVGMTFPLLARASIAFSLLHCGVAHAQSAPDPALANAPVTEAELRAHIAELASDAFGGRLPGTSGETLTAHYIARHLANAGFVGGAADGGFYQPVPLVELHLRGSQARWLAADGETVALDELSLRAPAGGDAQLSAPLVFVGYGVDATGAVRADVAGKIALMLFDNRPGDGALPLTARRDALVAAGAVATIVVGPPQFPFAALQNSFGSGRPQLASRISRGRMEGVASVATAERLLAGAGLTMASARSAAAADDYAGTATGGSLALQATIIRREYNSYNVVGRLPGRQPGSGTVVITGHWDHLGTCRPEGAGDRICNGAVDNASGIAVLLAVARRLGAGERPDRDIMIVGTTAEEQGLLGAYHMVAQPLVPLADIPILLNIDTVAIAPRGAPMAMVGRGTTPLDAEVDAVARALGRAIDADDEANAFIQRQDGWAFTQAGVPAVMAGGSFTDMTALQAFLGGHYHGPEDELTDTLPLGGAADDADLHVALARHFASTRAHRRDGSE